MSLFRHILFFSAATGLVPLLVLADYGGRLESMASEAITASRIAMLPDAISSISPELLQPACRAFAISPIVPSNCATSYSTSKLLLTTVSLRSLSMPHSQSACNIACVVAPAGVEPMSLPQEMVACLQIIESGAMTPVPSQCFSSVAVSSLSSHSEFQLASAASPVISTRAVAALTTPLFPMPASVAPRELKHCSMPPLSRDFAVLAAARFIREGLADGTLNPRNPAWRPYLAALLDRAAQTAEADSLYSTFLTGCAGPDARARMASAESWAREYDGGRFAETLSFCAARHSFVSGDYPAAIVRCEQLIAAHPKTADRAFLLLALSQAHSGNRALALQALNKLREQHPDSAVVPEGRLMEAWLALQDSHNEEAMAILREILTESPKAPAAAKAAKMLASLEKNK